MTDEQLINLVLDAIAFGNFGVSAHAFDRAAGRTVTRDDIKHAARTSDYEEVQDRVRGKIRFEGRDLDDEPLTVIAAYDAGVIIVSVF